MNTPIKKGRRLPRRALLTLATLVTLVAIFYQEENWRGKRAWEQCKAQLEAGGIVMNWNQYLPAPVPDDQNFFTANSNILMTFKRGQTEAERAAFAQTAWFPFISKTNMFPVFQSTKANPLVVAKIHLLSVAPENAPVATEDVVLKLDDPTAPEQVRNLLQKTMGRSLTGITLAKFSELQLSNLTPIRIALSAPAPLSVGDLEALIPKDLATNFGDLRIEASGEENTFEVRLTDVRMAAAVDYLKWSAQYEPALDAVRTALTRPYAVLPGEYSQPFFRPVPSFVTLRMVGQTLSQRAQCDILLGQPGEALRQLTLLHDVSRILTHAPGGKPVLLVESMINAVLTGLYVSTVADGFRLHVWHDAQLADLQKQLQSINLLPAVEESLREDVVGSAYTLDTTPPNQLLTVFQAFPNLEAKHFVSFMYAAPRGWRYQNMATAAQLEQKALAGFDLSNSLIRPEAVRAGASEVARSLSHWSPWNLWARVSLPDFMKPIETAAYHQTLVNQAQIVCALERYRLASGVYPDTLEALVPKYFDKLPHAAIGGLPMHYRRTDGVQFQLYSVGWDDKDAGGLAQNGTEDREHGDWIWIN